MCGKFLVANSCGLLYIELDGGHTEFLFISPFHPLLGIFFFNFHFKNESLLMWCVLFTNAVAFCISFSFCRFVDWELIYQRLNVITMNFIQDKINRCPLWIMYSFWLCFVCLKLELWNWMSLFVCYFFSSFIGECTHVHWKCDLIFVLISSCLHVTM